MHWVSRSTWGPIGAALVLVMVALTTWQLLLLEGRSQNVPVPTAARPDGETVTIHLRATNLDGLVLDPHIHDVVLCIRNTGPQSIKVVGFQGGCHGNCCFRAKPSQAMPLEIPTGTEIDFVAELRVYRPGPFEAPMVVYVDAGGLRELPITVNGTGAEDTAAPKDNP